MNVNELAHLWHILNNDTFLHREKTIYLFKISARFIFYECYSCIATFDNSTTSYKMPTKHVVG